MRHATLVGILRTGLIMVYHRADDNVSASKKTGEEGLKLKKIFLELYVISYNRESLSPRDVVLHPDIKIIQLITK